MKAEHRGSVDPSLTGDQEVVGLNLRHSIFFLLIDHEISSTIILPLTLIKKGSCQFLVKEWALYWTVVGCFGLRLNGPLRQYCSLYRAVSQREGERKKK